MGRLKPLELIDLAKPKRDPIDEHVAGFLANWDKKSTAMPAMIKGAARINYAAGVKDALIWVKQFNEQAKEATKPNGP